MELFATEAFLVESPRRSTEADASPAEYAQCRPSFSWQGSQAGSVVARTLATDWRTQPWAQWSAGQRHTK